MCTIQNPKKRFDYNAYIQGRLIGKYVVIYHDEVDEASTQDTIENPDAPTEDTEVIAVLPRIDNPDTYEVNVHRVNFNQSYHNTNPAYIALPNSEGLNVYTGRFVLPAKHIVACSRAGPN
jgi:hypothetical protein